MRDIIIIGGVLLPFLIYFILIDYIWMGCSKTEKLIKEILNESNKT